MTDQTDLGERILKLREVQQKSGLGRSTIYRQMAAGTFPAALQLTEYCVGWRRSEIDEWIRTRPRSGDYAALLRIEKRRGEKA